MEKNVKESPRNDDSKVDANICDEVENTTPRAFESRASTTTSITNLEIEAKVKSPSPSKKGDVSPQVIIESLKRQVFIDKWIALCQNIKI